VYRVNRPNVAAETVDGEVLMIHLETGNYYSLRGTGAAIWDAIEQEVPVVDVVDGLRGHLRVEDTEAVVDAFLAELVAEDLVGVAEPSGSAAAAPWDAVAFGDVSASPVLEKFTDMQHLIQLDPVHEVDATEGWPKLRSDA
jgi:hypothetical protein